MLWAQNPGATDNARGKELLGDAGKFLWAALATVGLKREDFDVQNVLRCRPMNKRGEEHPPTPLELHCCSGYSQEARRRNDGKAAVHLILGKVAAEQLLGKKYAKDTPVFWHEPWGAYVVLADHPSYVIRSGGKRSGWVYEEFRNRLRAVRSILEYPGHWGFVLGQPYRKYRTPKGVRAALRKIANKDAIGVDLEEGLFTDATGTERRAILQVTFSWGDYAKKGNWKSWKGGAFAVVLEHNENTSTPTQIEEVKGLLREFLARKKPQKIFQHGAYDSKIFKSHINADLKSYDQDAQYAAYLGHSNLQAYGLHNIAQRCFPEFADYKRMTVPYSGDYGAVPLDILVPYGCADADLTLRIYRTFVSDRTRALLRVYTKAAITLGGMEQRGPYLDYKALERVDAVIPTQIETLKNRIIIAAQDPGFNPNASQQIASLLFDKLKLPQLDGRSTAKEVLQTLADRTTNPIPSSVLAYRYLAKAKSTYIDGYRKSAEEHGGELRTRWNLTGAASGRLSSGGKSIDHTGIVNFQNFHGNPLLKNLLVSDKDWHFALGGLDPDSRVFLAFDFSQIEIRMLAEVTGDPLLISQFNSGLDIHCQVGHALTGWPVEQIAKDKEVRKLVKNLHFGIVYGISEGGLFDYLVAKGVKKITKKRATELHRAYFKKYSRVKEWIDEMRAQVEAVGYVENIFGFRRHIGAWDTSRTTYWGNQAINTPIQGAAHTLLLIALALLELKKKTFSLLQVPVMEVHDALVFFVRLGDLQEAYAQGQRLMQTEVRDYIKTHWNRELKVPLLAEGEAGYCYGSLVEYAGEPASAFLPTWRAKHEAVEAAAWEKLLPLAA